MERGSRSLGARHKPAEVTAGGTERLDQLQILRFVAAMAVVLFHLFNSFFIDFGAKKNYFFIGASGVDVFFVLSGFVIAYSVRPKAGPAYFMVRRIARIVPLYWALTLGIAVVALVLPKLLNSTTFSWVNLLRSLLFIPYEKENGLVQPMLFLGWTLNYEMFFYAIFASTLWFSRWTPLYPCVLIIALVALGRSLSIDSVAFKFYTDPIMLEFVFGVLLFLVWHFDRTLLRQYVAHFSVLFVVFTTFAASVEAGSFRPFVQGIAALSLVALALSVTLPKRYWASILLLFGNASYSLYLSHPYVIQIYSKLLGKDQNILVMGLGAVATLALCIGLSVVLYTVIEIRAQNGLVGWWVARAGRANRAQVNAAE